MMKLLLVIGLILGGCATKNVETARAAVAATAAVYGGSVESFLVYAKLPRCVKAPPPCSDAGKVATLGDKLVATREAIDRARNVVNLLPEQGDKTPVISLAPPQKALVDDAAAQAAESDRDVKAVKTGV